MNTFDVFKMRLASMNARIKDKNSEFVRVEVLGLEVDQIQKHKNDDQTIEIVGFDENSRETALVCPLGHFSARLSFEPKKKERKPIGFGVTESKEAEQVKIK